MTTAASPILLHAERLTAGYGKMAILHDVTLDVRVGEMVSVIGPNGAGKSTAFKTIVGFLRPTGGRVLFDGQDITGLRPDQVLPRGLAYVPQGRIVFPQMTVLENLEMGAYIERDGRRIQEALDRVYRLFPILAERRAQKAGTMSGGEQQMVAIGRALMTTPKLIIRLADLRQAHRDEAVGLHHDGGGAERGQGPGGGRPGLRARARPEPFRGPGANAPGGPRGQAPVSGGMTGPEIVNFLTRIPAGF